MNKLETKTLQHIQKLTSSIKVKSFCRPSSLVMDREKITEEKAWEKVIEESTKQVVETDQLKREINEWIEALLESN